MSYNAFAAYYDELMCDADYKGLAEYILSLFERHCKAVPSSVLDIACGTGSLDIELCRHGIEVIGCDSSVEMLTEAHRKADETGLDAFFLCQSMENIDMLHLVDGAVSTFDSLNHITDIKILKRVFERLSLFIRPGGFFIFDVNTEYKHREILADNVFVYDMPDVYCVWQNRYISDELSTEITLDFFSREKGERYSRQTEVFKERAYTANELEAIINETGFTVEGIYSERSFSPPKSNDQRVFYCIKKGI